MDGDFIRKKMSGKFQFIEIITMTSVAYGRRSFMI